jgi:rhodanese-related sulfurtransferase
MGLGLFYLFINHFFKIILLTLYLQGYIIKVVGDAYHIKEALMEFFIFIILFLTLTLYKRYVPVHGVRSLNLTDLDSNQITIIDIRDFNVSYKNPIDGAINIPTAYLKRNANSIQMKELYLVASNTLEKNVGIRILKRKGFRVAGYAIIGNEKPLISKCLSRCESHL